MQYFKGRLYFAFSAALTLETCGEIVCLIPFGDFDIGRISPAKLPYFTNIFRGNYTIFRWGPMKPILAQELTRGVAE